jgi:AraC-like DNA-binding protein
VRLRVGGLEIGEVVLEAARSPRRAQKAPPDFNRAVGLLRVLLTNVSAELRIHQLHRQLHRFRQSVRQLRTECGRLQHELRGPLPVLFLPGPTKTASATRPGLVDQMLAYANEHYHRPMSLKEVAQVLGRNASYLSTLFRLGTGLTFHAYLDELRLAKAKELLRDRTRTVAQAASETGYASEDWFRHAFKAHTGLSPSDWRASPE